ncbi:MAG: type III-B CRISPR module RAMP protein Cmr6 [Marinobacterium sp.]|nr:type III-B CRISPR module RAMP protein Cmr6 [Marinobacterium sp.]
MSGSKQPVHSEFSQPELGPSVTINRGLAFERYFNQYQSDWSVTPEAQRKFMEKLTGESGSCKCGDAKALQLAAARQQGLADAQKGQTFQAEADWRFVTGLGIPHPIENGLLWHPTLAVPYLPGASIKGLVRSALEPELAPEQLYFLFGSDHKDPACQAGERPMKSGALIFMDALPVKPVQLVLDVLTNHMGKWYERGDTLGRAATGQLNTDTILPADWQTPNPVSFLTTEQLTLQFSIVPRQLYRNHPHIAGWVKLAVDALQWTLQHEGAGAKTRTGYGSFTVPDEQTSSKQRDDLRKQWRDHSEVASMSEAARGMLELEDAVEVYEDALKARTASAQQASSLRELRSQLMSSASEWTDVERQSLYQLLVRLEQSVTTNKQTRRKNLRKYEELLQL